MATFLSIALLIVGSTATLAAFGGKTCEEGTEPILERINVRGWISLGCLALALGLGIWKQLTDTQEKHQAAVDATADKAAADRAHAAENLEAKDRQEKLEAQLRDATAKLTLLQERNEAQGKNLEDVRTTLSATSKALGSESAANLVTGFALANKDIRFMVLYLPLTAWARRSMVFRDALLPSFENASCRELTGLQVLLARDLFNSATADFDRIDYYPGDSSDHHDYLDKNELNPGFDDMVRFETREDKRSLDAILRETDQTSSNSYLYGVGIRPGLLPLPGAPLLSYAMKPNSRIVYITTTWPTLFRTKTELGTAKLRYPKIVQDDQMIVLSPLTETAGPRPKYPASCSIEIERYFRSAFDKGELSIEFKGSPTEFVRLKLKALPPELHNGMWAVPFVLASIPDFSVYPLPTLGHFFPDDKDQNTDTPRR